MTYQTRVRSEPTYEVHVERDVMVTMRDGVRLATDVYRPAVSGRPVERPFPVVLQRTPYDKGSERMVAQARYFAQRGYAVVLQDNRGRYKSEGYFVKYTQDAPDGYDCVEWIARQPWSTGATGTFGTSYGAHTQGAVASTNPPHLSTMLVDCGAFSNAYMSSCRHNGAFELRQVAWAISQAKLSKDARDNPVIAKALSQVSMEEWFQRMPWKKGHSPLRWTPDYESYLMEIWTHADYDDYWKQPGLCGEQFYDQWSDIPQLHSGGWYDSYTRTTFENFVGLSQRKRGPIRLLMGPWTHGQRSVSYSGDVEFGPTAALDGNLAESWEDFHVMWYDAWLKGLDNGVRDQPPLRLFIMGGGDGRKNAQGRMYHGGYWRFESEWPLARTRFTSYYLHPDGTLSPERPAGRAEPSRYLFDPDNPVPTIGGNLSGGLMTPAGAFHQQERPDFYGSRLPYLPLSSRPDVLVFQTPPLEEDVEVTGPITVNLWISSSALDTDFTAKLLDVYPPNVDYPDGFDMNLTDSILRVRYRDSWERPELMKPGTAYRISFPLYPTGNLFKKGHRIRVDISSSNFPRFDVNPNTGGPLGVDQRKLVAENAIYHDPQHPSHVVLPVSPAQA
ncbi:MAG: CocE/NonD family hydrolase [Chloroflexi bacterium]|nr:CocE/NonD family hydrolase [Chloroflexota bacterium]